MDAIGWIFMRGDSDWKRYVTLSCITCIFVLVATATINYSIDPSHLFGRGSYEQKVAEILSKRGNAAIVANYDERLVQLEYITRLKSHNEAILLGSSRGMQVRFNQFGGRSFFNHAVSGASIEDYIAIYQMYLDKSFLPFEIVIALDPWILNRNSGQSRWQSVAEYYRKFVDDHRTSAKHGSSVNSFGVNKWLNLVSLAYLEASLKSFLRIGNHNESQNAPFLSVEDDLDVDVVRHDGSRNYNRSYRNRTSEEVEKDAVTYALGDPVYSLGQFRNIDKKATYFLELLVDDMIRRGIHVFFLFMPYHPEAYQRLIARPEYRIVADVQSHLEMIAGNRGIRTIGSYNPSDIGLEGIDFLDGMHPKESAVDKMWQVYDVNKVLR